MALNLPTARSLTLAATDPVPSALLNEVQDQFVGAKHPQLEVPVPACEWQLESGGAASLGAGIWTFGAASNISAPIRAPIGTRIVTANIDCDRGGSGSITFYLLERIGAAAATIVTSVAITTGTGRSVIPFAVPCNKLMVSGSQYFLRVATNNVANVVYCANYFIDRL